MHSYECIGFSRRCSRFDGDLLREFLLLVHSDILRKMGMKIHFLRAFGILFRVMALMNGIFVHFVGNSLMRAMHQKFVLCMIIERILFNQQFAMVSESWIHVMNCLLLNRATYRDRFFRFTFVSLSVSAFQSFLCYELELYRYVSMQGVVQFLCPFFFCSNFSRFIPVSPLYWKKVERWLYFTLCFVKYFCLPILRYVVQLFARCCHVENRRHFFLFIFLPLKHFITPTNESWMGIKLLRILNYLISQFPALSKPLFYLLPLFFFNLKDYFYIIIKDDHKSLL